MTPAAASQSPPTAISQRLYRVPSPDEPDGPYSFICECFFLTARALHLGPIRVLTTLKNIQRQIHRVKEELFLTEAELSMTAPGTARHRQLSAEVRGRVGESWGATLGVDCAGVMSTMHRT